MTLEVLVRSLIGFSATSEIEDHIREVTGRDAEDAALDYNVECCGMCGVWQESCEMRSDIAEETGCVVCCTCEPELDE
ncbi:MAG: hypothetical protein HQL38_10865 [Alphaproteobacteria bacterium]|nr:hypothetical protein [Alphaproteobacteria bacterium]